MGMCLFCDNVEEHTQEFFDHIDDCHQNYIEQQANYEFYHGSQEED